MLAGKGQTDNGDGQQESEEHMHQPRPKASEYHPKEVEGNTQATWRASSWLHTRPERPQTEQSKLECLQSQRYAYDGDSQCQSAGKIANGSLKDAKNPPDEVSE